MSCQQLKDGRWVCIWRDNGKMHKEYFGRGDLAERKARERDQTLKQANKIAKDGMLTVNELCQQYHAQHPVRHSTGVNNFYKFTRLILPILGHHYAEKLKSQHLNQYIQKRIAAGVKFNTVRRELSLLKAVYNWARRQVPPLIAFNAIHEYRFKGPDDKDVPMPPTEPEIERIMAAAEPHLVRSLVISWYLGIRPGSEATNLKWSDVDLHGKLIRVVSAHKGGPAIRYVPISEGLLPYLEQWKKEDGDLIMPLVHYRGKEVVSLKHSWATAKKRAGVTRRMRLYDIRHAFATQLLERGIPCGTVSKLIGHSREDTTQRHYLHVTEQHSRDAVELVPKLGSHLGNK